MNLSNPINIDSETFSKLIKGELSSDSSYSKFYTKEGTSGDLSVIIKDCEIEPIYLNDKVDYPFNILIINSKLKGISIFNGTYKSLHLSNITIEENNYFSISGGEFKSFYLSGNIGCDAYIRKASFNKLYFGDTDFKNNLTIQSGTFEEVYFSGIKAKSFFIRGGRFSKFLLAGGTHLNDCDISGLYFLGGRFDTAQIYGLSKINKIYINSGFIASMVLESEWIAEIAIQNHADEGSESSELGIGSLFFNQLGKTNISIKDIDINLINFNDSFINKDSIMRFSDIRAGALNFNNVINYGQITFNKISLANRLSIQYSDLGKTTFINCDLSLSNLSFGSSKITDVFLASTDMPENMIGTTHKEMRSAYGQIKKVYENRGDTIGASLFFSKEMNAYYDTLSWKTDKAEIINLLFNKLSTNHGQSWKRGLASALTVSFAFYCLYLYLLGFRIITHGSFDVFLTQLSYFSDFINPVHKTDFIVTEQEYSLPDIRHMGLARMCEGISRIFIAYFIYQLIQAFRKHGKK
jgi:uncharacterized protein YjbI with pentapeptide repeats